MESSTLVRMSLFTSSLTTSLIFKYARTVPPYSAAALAIIFVAYGSHKTNKRGLWIIGSGAVAIVGYIVLLTTKTAGARYAGIFITVVGIYSANGLSTTLQSACYRLTRSTLALLLSWPSENVSPQTKRATASGIQIFVRTLCASGKIKNLPQLLCHRSAMWEVSFLFPLFPTR